MDQPILPIANQYKKFASTITPFMESPKTKNYSTVIFFFLVLSVFGWYAIRPTIQTILYLQREIKDKTEVDKKMDEKIYALIEANTAYENNQQLFPVLNEAIPTSPDALDIARQMNVLAQEKGVLLSRLQMGDIPLASSSAILRKKSDKPYSEIQITCQLEGPYASIISYLKELVAIRRIITIQSMTFAPLKRTEYTSTESAKIASIQVNIQLKAYYETK